MRKFKIEICKLFVFPCHALHSICFAYYNLTFIAAVVFFNSGCPFQSVSPVCSWLVLWCLKWLWFLLLPGVPGAFQTLHVKNDKEYCDFPVVCFFFSLKIYWLHWAQSSVAGWDGLNFQHFWSTGRGTKKFWYQGVLFFRSLLACRFQQFVWRNNCLVSVLTNSEQKPA